MPKENSVRIAAITMLRRSEFPAAWSSLATVEPQLNESTHHFLLLNDANDDELIGHLRARPFTSVLTPGQNLGVAKGRNLLIRAALDWGAETLISLDDDLLVPRDYLERISTWIQERLDESEPVGVVTPATLDFHAVAEVTMSSDEIERAEAGLLEHFPDTETLRQRLARAWPGGVPVDAMYHAGIREWRYHYLESYRSRAARLRTLYLNSRGIRETQITDNEIRLRDDARTSIILGGADPIRIDTAPGGACAYTADLLRAIGGIDEAFSPFGYEDSDFSIRALRAGFQNYSLISQLLLHDLDSRQKTRSPAILLHSQGRARALIARKHVTASERPRVLAEVAALAPLQAVDLVGATGGRFPSRTGGILGAVVAYASGFVEGLFATPDEPDVAQSGHSRDYPAPSHRLERAFKVRHRSWARTPTTGLPRAVDLEGVIAYNWNPENGRFALNRLAVDAPGQIRAVISAEIDRVGLRDAHGNPDPLACRLVRMSVKVEDWGFLDRIQSTIAWFRRERSPGYFAMLFRSPTSRFARSAKHFVSLGREPACLKVEAAPSSPIQVADLLAFPSEVTLRQRLGLTAMVNKRPHY